MRPQLKYLANVRFKRLQTILTFWPLHYTYNVRMFVENKKGKEMEIKYKDIKTGEEREAILIARIDEYFFDCKSSNKKKQGDLLIHIDTIISDVFSVPYTEDEYEDDDKPIFCEDTDSGVYKKGDLIASVLCGSGSKKIYEE